MKLYLKAALALSVLATAPLAASNSARADSCWDHNGSIMRLVASGNQRWFYYERPRSVLRAAGVRRGTLLFNGVKRGNSYFGTARRFSRFCRGRPQRYRVSGPVSRNQLRVTVYGTREVNRQCRPTGRFAEDRLVFTYAYDC